MLVNAVPLGLSSNPMTVPKTQLTSVAMPSAQSLSNMLSSNYATPSGAMDLNQIASSSRNVAAHSYNMLKNELRPTRAKLQLPTFPKASSVSYARSFVPKKVGPLLRPQVVEPENHRSRQARHLVAQRDLSYKMLS